MTLTKAWAAAIGWALLYTTLAAVFVVAGVGKLQDGPSFAASIARFQILPLALVNPLAMALPPLEILCGLALLLPRWRRRGAFGIAVLTLIFLVALISAAIRGIEVECSCFGAGRTEPLWRAILRDLLLIGAACAIYLRALFQGSSPAAAQNRTGALNPTAGCLQ